MPEVLTPKLTLKELVRRLETLQAQCAELVKLRRRPALQLVAETAQPAQIGRARTRRTLSRAASLRTAFPNCGMAGTTRGAALEAVALLPSCTTLERRGVVPPFGFGSG